VPAPIWLLSSRSAPARSSRPTSTTAASAREGIPGPQRRQHLRVDRD
jgi:hypothetical protein